MLKGGMKSFTVTAMLDTMKQLDDLAKKYKVSRSRVAKALIVAALSDKVSLQKAIDIL